MMIQLMLCIAYVSVAPTDFSFSGLPDDQDWIEKDMEYDLSCTVGSVRPDGTLSWELGSRTIEMETDSTDGQPPEGIGYRLTGTATDVVFDGSESPVDVMCVVNTNSEELGQQKYRTVDVYCKYL